MFNHKAVARRLLEARGEARPSAWSRKLGVSVEVLARLEAGEEPPSLECLYRIHLASGVSLTWLITGQGPKFDPTMSTAGPGQKGPKPGARQRRNFSDQSLAELAAGLIGETSLPKHEREILSDLVVEAINDPQKRETVILIHRFLKFARLHRERD